MAKRRRLNRDRVIEAAVEMADEAGRPDAVTLTALADRLDVRTPSLYNHIDSLADLHHGMAVYAVRRLVDCVRGAAAGKLGREALISMAGAYRRFAHDHPGVYPLVVRAPDPGEATLAAVAQELLQILLLVFASFGLDGDDALHAVRGFRSVLHGFVALEAADGFKMTFDLDESYQRLITTYLDGLVSTNSLNR